VETQQSTPNRWCGIKTGIAGLYLDEATGKPLLEFRNGDHFGELALSAPADHPRNAASVKAETPWT